MSLYYLIWSDAISSIKKNHPQKKTWKIEIYIFISWINSINLWILYIWLKFFNLIQIPLPKIDIFPGYVLDSFISFTLIFAFPFLILNYFLLFHKNRYEMILEKYPIKKYRYGSIYTITIILTGFASAILYGILSR